MKRTRVVHITDNNRLAICHRLDPILCVNISYLNLYVKARGTEKLCKQCLSALERF